MKFFTSASLLPRLRIFSYSEPKPTDIVRKDFYTDSRTTSPVSVMSDQYWDLNGESGVILRATLRALQIIFAIVVAALYGVDLQLSTNSSTHDNSSRVFAEVVAGISVISCGILCFVTVNRVAWCILDFVIFIWWVALFGVFGTIYIGSHENPKRFFTISTSRMKVAVWIDFLNMLLWFATFLGGVIWCCTTRRVSRRPERLGLDEEARNASPNLMTRDKEDSDYNTDGKRRNSFTTPYLIKSNDSQTTLRELGEEMFASEVKQVKE